MSDYAREAAERIASLSPGADDASYCEPIIQEAIDAATADLRAENERLTRWLTWFAQDKRSVAEYLRARGCTAEDVAEVDGLLKGEK